MRDAFTDRTRSNAQEMPNARLQPEYSARYVRYVIVLLALVNVFSYVDRMALAVLAPLIKVDLRLSDTQVGLLVGFSFSLFYAICGIPIARWADRGVRRNIIAIALATWSVMTGLSGAAQNFWHLFVARVGVGAGEAGGYSPGSSIICDYVPLRQRSGAFAIFTFGSYAGMMLGLAIGGSLGESIGWRWTFLAFGLPGIALAMIVRLTLREPVRGLLDAGKSDLQRLSLSATLRVLWRCRTYRSVVLFLIANGFVQYGLNQWWPSLYARVFGLNLASVGVYLGIAIGVGSAMGLLIGGLLANKAAQRYVRLPLMISAASTLLAVPAAAATLFMPSPLGSILFVWLAALLWCVSNGPALATQASVVTSQMRATAISIAVFLTSVFGFGLGPFCVGLLSDKLAPALGVEALRYAMLLPVCLLPVMAIALYAAGKALPNDLRAVGAPIENDSHATSAINGAAWNGDRGDLPVVGGLASEAGER